MIKENQNILNKLQIVLDLTTVILSFLLAYYLRFYVMQGMISIGIDQSLIPILFSIPVYFILYNSLELYAPKRTKSIYKECGDIIKANIIGFLILILGLYTTKLINFSRLALIFFIFFNTIITIAIRIVIRFTLRNYRRKGYNQKHCLIVGATETSSDLIDRIKKNTHWGYNIIGIVDNKNIENYEGYRVLGRYEQLEQILNTKHIDIIFVAIEGEDFKSIGKIIKQCEKAGVKTNIIPYYYKYVPAKPYMDDLDGLPVIDTRYVPVNSWICNLGKRAFDICFAIIAIIITSPIMLLSVIMIKITSPGPIIYKQERVGLDRKNFYMYKFRSMNVQKEEEEKTQWSTKNDPRKTKWGSIMRRTSIDELPQFFNVLKGDMSIVGPRPERPYFVDKFKDEIPRYMIKHQVRPGITGWAQVSGYRGDTSIEKRIDHDLHYIENWTFLFDIRIVFLTIFKGFVNKNAY